MGNIYNARVLSVLMHDFKHSGAKTFYF